LGSDLWTARRIAVALRVEHGDGVVNGAVEVIRVGEGLVGLYRPALPVTRFPQLPGQGRCDGWEQVNDNAGRYY
jgi:hypothetical protein